MPPLLDERRHFIVQSKKTAIRGLFALATAQVRNGCYQGFRKLKIERVGKLLCNYYYKQEIVNNCCGEHKNNFESKKKINKL